MQRNREKCRERERNAEKERDHRSLKANIKDTKN